jgi:hypothetical protein
MCRGKAPSLSRTAQAAGTLLLGLISFRLGFSLRMVLDLPLSVRTLQRVACQCQCLTRYDPLLSFVSQCVHAVI